VNVRVVVSGVGDCSEGGLDISALFFGADHNTNGSSGVYIVQLVSPETTVQLTSWNSSERPFGNGESLLASLLQFLDQRQVHPNRFRLSRDISPLLQGLVEQGEVWGLEECFGRTNGIRRVGDDNVVFSFVLG
jgi:hypothetical protein